MAGGAIRLHSRSFFFGDDNDSDQNKGVPNPNSGKTRKLRGSQRGEKGATAILTTENVIEIKRMLKQGIWERKFIANRFGVKPCTIDAIRNGQNWSHI